MTGDGTSRLTLEPLSASPAKAGTAGKRLAVVRTGEDTRDRHRGAGLGAASTGRAARGACWSTGSAAGPRPAAARSRCSTPIRDTEACWERSVYPPLADAPVELGETFTVPGEGVRIEAEGRTKSGAWTVKIPH